MNFTIPRNNASELVLYFWKIIDLPKITEKNLLYKLSFDLFLFPPDKAELFIASCIEKEILIKNDKNMISLSRVLDEKLRNWQKKRKNAILNNIKTKEEKKNVFETLVDEKKTDFGVLLKAFSDKGALNRAVSISDIAVEISEFDFEKGEINAKIAGSKDSLYDIKIDTNNKSIYHDCHDFKERRSKDKKFCKHLVKLFLILKAKNEASTTKFLENIANSINKWDFSG